MLVYGKNVLKEINPKNVKKVYCSKKDYLDLLNEKHLKYEFVENHRLDQMVNGLHQGIIIDVYDYEYHLLSEVNEDLVVILDHLEDPHNFGAIIRTCAGLGIESIIIPKDRSVKVNETVIKVSEGTIEKVKVIMVSNLVNAINYLKKAGYYIYCADMNGKDLKKIDYSLKKVLIVGNEGSGISRLIKENSDELVSIKLENNVESLNVSVATGIILYEMKGLNEVR